MKPRTNEERKLLAEIEEQIAIIIGEQGWSMDSRLFLHEQFVKEKRLETQFLEFIQRQAADENKAMLANDEEIVPPLDDENELGDQIQDEFDEYSRRLWMRRV